MTESSAGARPSPMPAPARPRPRSRTWSRRASSACRCDDIAALGREMQRRLTSRAATASPSSPGRASRWRSSTSRPSARACRWPLSWAAAGARRCRPMPAWCAMAARARSPRSRAPRSRTAIATSSCTRSPWRRSRPGARAVGAEIRLTTDVNCNWSLAQSEELLPRMKALDLALGRGAGVSARGFRDARRARATIRRAARRR